MYSDFVPFSSSVNIKNGELTASFSHPEFIHDLLFARNFQNILHRASQHANWERDEVKVSRKWREEDAGLNLPGT